MAKPTLELIEALRATATRLRNGGYYAWGNHGACNCGNLVQSVTSLTRQEILKYAQAGIGEWTELAEEFCGNTNAPVNLLINKLEMIGLTPTDIHNIEYLRDKQVLHALPGGFRWPARNVREDVIVYFETFATILEEKLLCKIDVPFNQLLNHRQSKKNRYTINEGEHHQLYVTD
ncbi:MAG: hypothetical protein JWQ40_1184 [Segetibacter sp.]|jgi:hypothetical protein|nr:hypothetical protein [Segetibacter sp.]